MSRSLHIYEPRYPTLAATASLVFMGTDDITLPPVGTGLARLAAKLLLIFAIAWGIHMLMDWTTAQAMATGNAKLMIGMFATLLVAYALLIAVPFMPGIEIGISLLLLKGATIAPLVYLATLLGLLIAYTAGRFLPHKWLHDVLADLRLKRACHLVNRLAPLSRQERLALLTERAPVWLKPLIGAWRYPLLAALINIPGNAVIGGGGGIAFTAGFSRLFRPGWTVVTIALAVLPVPLIVWWTGSTRILP